MPALMQWDDRTGDMHEHVVWWTRLDDRYQIEVQELEGEKPTLRIFDKDKDFEEIYSEVVTLAYGAIFGPDVADVQVWQDRSLQFIDNEYQADA